MSGIIRPVVVLALLFCAPIVHAQPPPDTRPPTQAWANWASYGSAVVNPTVAAIEAWRSPQRKCRLGQLAISEAVGNGTSMLLKHFIVSPRPCLGCASDGMPSGHTMNSTIGFSSSWRLGVGFVWGTAVLRKEAHRHTPWQVAAGAALGIGAEAAGHLLRCE
jgi:membrane-associated phospholipid phosphatase